MFKFKTDTRKNLKIELIISEVLAKTSPQSSKLSSKQPRSQGSLLHERDPGNAGHVSPRRKKPGRVPVSESFVATKFCKHQNEAHFYYFSTSRFASSIAATRISIINRNNWRQFILEKMLSVFCQRDTENLSFSICYRLDFFFAKVSSRAKPTEQLPIHPVITVVLSLYA